MNKNQRNKESLLYYVLIFIAISAGVAIFGLFPVRRDGLEYIDWISIYWPYPFLVVIMLFFYKRLTSKMFKKLDRQNQEQNFILHMSGFVKDELKFEVEDFRRLRENDKFQKALFDAYTIYLDGETAEFSYEKIAQKFEKGTKEQQAVDIVIRETKILRKDKDK